MIEYNSMNPRNYESQKNASFGFVFPLTPLLYNFVVIPFL